MRNLSMLKTAILGATLFATYSCNSPTIEEPVKMYQVNQNFYEAGVGFKNLNYKTKDREKIGNWLEAPEFLPLNEVPNDLTCFGTDDWLKKIKPKLKEAHDYYYR